MKTGQMELKSISETWMDIFRSLGFLIHKADYFKLHPSDFFIELGVGDLLPVMVSDCRTTQEIDIMCEFTNSELLKSSGTPEYQFRIFKYMVLLKYPINTREGQIIGTFFVIIDQKIKSYKVPFVLSNKLPILDSDPEFLLSRSETVRIWNYCRDHPPIPALEILRIRND